MRKTIAAFGKADVEFLDGERMGGKAPPNNRAHKIIADYLRENGWLK